MVIVDTSVFINYFKGKETEATRHLEGILDKEFYLVPIVYQELLQGARDEKEFTTLQTYLSSQQFLQTNDPIKTYEAAARIYFDCKKKE